MPYTGEVIENLQRISGAEAEATTFRGAVIELLGKISGGGGFNIAYTTTDSLPTSIGSTATVPSSTCTPTPDASAVGKFITDPAGTIARVDSYDPTAGLGVTVVAQGVTAGIPEAPTDGKLYGRKNSAWDEVTAGTTNTLTIWKADLATTPAYQLQISKNTLSYYSGYNKSVSNDLTHDLIILNDADTAHGELYRIYNDTGGDAIARRFSLEEAPADTKQYARKDGAWTEVSTPTVAGNNFCVWEYSLSGTLADTLSAAVGDIAYKSGNNKTTPELYDMVVVNKGTTYVSYYIDAITSTTATLNKTAGLLDAPSDTKLYGRKDGAWTEITTTGNYVPISRYYGGTAGSGIKHITANDTSTEYDDYNPLIGLSSISIDTAGTPSSPVVITNKMGVIDTQLTVDNSYLYFAYSPDAIFMLSQNNTQNVSQTISSLRLRHANLAFRGHYSSDYTHSFTISNLYIAQNSIVHIQGIENIIGSTAMVKSPDITITIANYSNGAPASGIIYIDETYNGTLTITPYTDTNGVKYMPTIIDRRPGNPLGTFELKGQGGGVPEAPEDNKTYGRKNANWVEVTGGTGTDNQFTFWEMSSTVPDATLTGSDQQSFDFSNLTYKGGYSKTNAAVGDLISAQTMYGNGAKHAIFRVSSVNTTAATCTRCTDTAGLSSMPFGTISTQYVNDYIGIQHIIQKSSINISNTAFTEVVDGMIVVNQSYGSGLNGYNHLYIVSNVTPGGTQCTIQMIGDIPRTSWIYIDMPNTIDYAADKITISDSDWNSNVTNIGSGRQMTTAMIGDNVFFKKPNDDKVYAAGYITDIVSGAAHVTYFSKYVDGGSSPVAAGIQIESAEKYLTLSSSDPAKDFTCEWQADALVNNTALIELRLVDMTGPIAEVPTYLIDSFSSVPGLIVSGQTTPNIWDDPATRSYRIPAGGYFGDASDASIKWSLYMCMVEGNSMIDSFRLYDLNPGNGPLIFQTTTSNTVDFNQPIAPDGSVFQATIENFNTWLADTRAIVGSAEYLLALFIAPDDYDYQTSPYGMNALPRMQTPTQLNYSDTAHKIATDSKLGWHGTFVSNNIAQTGEPFTSEGVPYAFGITDKNDSYTSVDTGLNEYVTLNATTYLAWKQNYPNTAATIGGNCTQARIMIDTDQDIDFSIDWTTRSAKTLEVMNTTNNTRTFNMTAPVDNMSIRDVILPANGTAVFVGSAYGWVRTAEDSLVRSVSINLGDDGVNVASPDNPCTVLFGYLKTAYSVAPEGASWDAEAIWIPTNSQPDNTTDWPMEKQRAIIWHLNVNLDLANWGSGYTGGMNLSAGIRVINPSTDVLNKQVNYIYGKSEDTTLAEAQSAAWWCQFSAPGEYLVTISGRSDVTKNSIVFPMSHTPTALQGSNMPYGMGEVYPASIEQVRNEAYYDEIGVIPGVNASGLIMKVDLQNTFTDWCCFTFGKDDGLEKIFVNSCSAGNSITLQYDSRYDTAGTVINGPAVVVTDAVQQHCYTLVKDGAVTVFSEEFLKDEGFDLGKYGDQTFDILFGQAALVNPVQTQAVRFFRKWDAETTRHIIGNVRKVYTPNRNSIGDQLQEIFNMSAPYIAVRPDITYINHQIFYPADIAFRLDANMKPLWPVNGLQKGQLTFANGSYVKWQTSSAASPSATGFIEVKDAVTGVTAHLVDYSGLSNHTLNWTDFKFNIEEYEGVSYAVWYATEGFYGVDVVDANGLWGYQSIGEDDEVSFDVVLTAEATNAGLGEPLQLVEETSVTDAINQRWERTEIPYYITPEASKTINGRDASKLMFTFNTAMITTTSTLNPYGMYYIQLEKTDGTTIYDMEINFNNVKNGWDINFVYGTGQSYYLIDVAQYNNGSWANGVNPYVHYLVNEDTGKFMFSFPISKSLYEENLVLKMTRSGIPWPDWSGKSMEITNPDIIFGMVAFSSVHEIYTAVNSLSDYVMNLSIDDGSIA